MSYDLNHTLCLYLHMCTVQVGADKLPAQSQSHLYMCRRAGSKSNTGLYTKLKLKPGTDVV